MPLKACSN